MKKLYGHRKHLLGYLSDNIIYDRHLNIAVYILYPFILDSHFNLLAYVSMGVLYNALGYPVAYLGTENTQNAVDPDPAGYISTLISTATASMLASAILA